MLNPWPGMGVSSCGCVTSGAVPVVLCDGHDDPRAAAARAFAGYRRALQVAGRRRRRERARVLGVDVDEVRVRRPGWRAPELEDPEVGR